MRRFFINPLNITGEKVLITGGEAKHLSKVLRLKDGEKVIALDGLGNSYLVELVTVNEEAVKGVIKEEISISSETLLEVTLVQSILKGEKMEWVIQKATELGVSRIIPLESERTVVRLNQAKAEDRRKRWEKIAQEAVKQCGRILTPEIAPVQSWEEALSQFGPNDLVLLPWEGEHNQSLKDILRERPNPERVAFFIGPEGGFSPKEAGRAIESGARSVSLGPRILRAETAALTVLSIILYELADLGTARNI